MIESTGTRAVQLFAPAFFGGTSVTLGDVDGDGTVDIISGAGPGGGPHVRVLSSGDLSELASFYAFDPSFAGGVHVASGDIDGDGHADIIVGAGAGGGPHVRVFSGRDLSELASFFAYNPAFLGGVFVAAGDIDGDGLADIVTGAGAGGGPHVRVFSGSDLRELASFFAYDPAFAGGVSVAAGDVNDDGLSDIITGAGAGGGPHVRVFSGDDLGELASFYAFGSAFSGGVNVASGDYNGDGHVDLILGAGPGGGPHVVVVSGLDFSELDNFFVAGMSGSVAIGSAGDGTGLRFTSPTTTTFTAGSPGTFTITTVGQPPPMITLLGDTLPAGVTFTDNHDGTATLAGTPGPGTGGSYDLTFTAGNGVGTPKTQAFTLTVNEALSITSGDATIFTTGAAGTFQVTTTGFPLPTITRGGATLPSGVSWVDNNDGTGTLSGTPAAGTGGTYAITFTADNGVSPAATQSFTLTVRGAPTFTSGTSTTFSVGAPGSFTVTAVGSPTPTLTAGALPAGVTFVAHPDGTGTLSGTPASGTGGAHTLTFTAANGVLPNATQTFTLNINETPAITSASSVTFQLGAPNSFTVTTSGFPAPTIARGGASLPSGVNFVDNGDGTGTLSGTPGAGTGGTYALTFTATNTVGSSAPQTFTLSVTGSPGFTSAATATFTVGTPGTFTVTTIGSPTPTITLAGALPAGVSFTDNGNGTATLSGTPAGGSGGAYPLTFTAVNGVLPNGTQAFTLNVNQAPAITSAPAATFIVGVPGSFTVTTSGFPAPSIARGGVGLPSGVNFTDNGNGTGTLSGTPAAGTGGTYAISFTATNTVGSSAPQSFTLTVTQPPTFTSATSTTFTVGAAGTFTVTAVGSPTPAITVTGALPSGVSFVDNGDGTGTLSGTPAAGTGGAHALTFTASNGVLPDGTQAFTLNVNEAPAITSAANVTFTVGAAGSFTVTTSGFPAPSIAQGGVGLPSGVNFTDNGNGTGTLSGTPAAGTGGTYAISFTAINTAGTSPTQSFTLTVNQTPAITSANTTNFTVGQAGGFTVTTSGFPMPTLARGGVALPTGVTFVDNGNGTGTLAGTPGVGTGGSYAITFTATNSVGSSPAQAFTLNVQAPPAITSANNASFTVGTPGTFTVTTTGFPTPTISQTGTLPTGVTFTPATKVLGGTATQTGTFPLVFAATNAVPPDATQNFTLNVVCPAITVTPTSLPDGLYQTAYGPVDFNQTGSTGSTFTWSATGPLAGLAIDPGTGIVSGTPTTTVAAAAVTIIVTDNFGCQGSVATTLTIRPVAVADAFTGGVGNTQYVVGTSVTTPAVVKAGNVKSNDNGPGTLTVSFNAPASGAVLEGATDGTFIYTPNVAFGGPTDTFTYTLTDGNGVTNTATVTIALSGMVWYVNSAGGAGDGRSNTPFNTLNAAATPSALGSQIYVHTGTGTTTGNLAMDANQTLHGAGAAFALNDLAIAAGTRPTLSGTVTLADNDIVRAVNFSGAATALSVPAGAYTAAMLIDQVNVTLGTTGLQVGAATATGAAALTVSSSTFTNTGGAEISMNGGNLPVTFPATTTISGNAGRLIDIQNRTGGTVSFAGAISDSGGTGILLDNNGTSTFSFSGGLTLNGAATTFAATNPSLNGTLTITGTNTIGATTAPTTATALNVTNVNIGASGLTFQRISAGTAAGSAGNGIILDNTGTAAGNGSLTVTGTGSAGSGGTIQHKTGADGVATGGIGIYLNNTKSPSFARMQLNDFDNFAIRGFNVQGFTLTNSVLNGVNGNNDGVDEAVIRFDNLTVSGLIDTCTILGGVETNIRVINNTGTLNALVVQNSTIRSNSATTGGDGFFARAQSGATMTVKLLNNIMWGHRDDHIQTDAENSGVMHTVITGNTLTSNGTVGAPPQPSTLGGQITISGGAAFSSTSTFNVSNNTITGSVPAPITIGVASTTSLAAGLLSGTIDNNQLGQSGSANSGSSTSDGLSVIVNGASTINATITNNDIFQFNNIGMQFIKRDGAGNLNLTVTGNTVQQPVAPNALQGILVTSGATGPDTGTVCADIGGGGALGNTVNGPNFGGDLIRVRQRFGTTVRLPGYAGGGTDTAAVVSYLTGRNTITNEAPNAKASATTQAPGSFAGGVACTAGALPQ